MITLTAGETKTLQTVWKDAAGNTVTPGFGAVIEWSVTGPVQLANTNPSDAGKKLITSTGQPGTATVTAKLGPGSPSEVVATEAITITTGPIVSGQIVTV